MLLLQEDHRGPTAKHELYDLRAVVGRLFLRLYSLPPAKMCIWECSCIISGWRQLVCNTSEFSCLPDNLRAGKWHLRHRVSPRVNFWVKTGSAASVVCVKHGGGHVQSDVSCLQGCKGTSERAFDSFILLDATQTLHETLQYFIWFRWLREHFRHIHEFCTLRPETSLLGLSLQS